MGKQKFPIQWILAFALTPLVLIGLVVLIRLSGSGKTATQQSHADVQRVVRIYPTLKPEYNRAMADKKLTLEEANSILKKANAMTKKGKK